MHKISASHKLTVLLECMYTCDCYIRVVESNVLHWYCPHVDSDYKSRNKLLSDHGKL